MGEQGPRQLQVPRETTVADAAPAGSWSFSHARSNLSKQLLTTLAGITPPITSSGHDCYLWRRPDDTFSNMFSSKGTWEQQRDHYPLEAFGVILGKRLCREHRRDYKTFQSGSGIRVPRRNSKVISLNIQVSLSRLTSPLSSAINIEFGLDGKVIKRPLK